MIVGLWLLVGFITGLWILWDEKRQQDNYANKFELTLAHIVWLLCPTLLGFVSLIVVIVLLLAEILPEIKIGR